MKKSILQAIEYLIEILTAIIPLLILSLLSEEVSNMKKLAFIGFLGVVAIIFHSILIDYLIHHRNDRSKYAEENTIIIFVTFGLSIILSIIAGVKIQHIYFYYSIYEFAIFMIMGVLVAYNPKDLRIKFKEAKNNERRNFQARYSRS